MLYAFETVAAIASRSQHQREHRKLRRYYKKSKPAPLTDGGQQAYRRHWYLMQKKSKKIDKHSYIIILVILKLPSLLYTLTPQG